MENLGHSLWKSLDLKDFLKWQLVRFEREQAGPVLIRERNGDEARKTEEGDTGPNQTLKVIKTNRYAKIDKHCVDKRCGDKKYVWGRELQLCFSMSSKDIYVQTQLSSTEN